MPFFRKGQDSVCIVAIFVGMSLLTQYLILDWAHHTPNTRQPCFSDGLLVSFACGSANTQAPSTSAPSATTPSEDSPQTPFASSVVGTPVSRSDVESAFEEPLSSGLSVVDVVENALPSVVHIIAGSGTGTGLIINEGGLVVTNKHVVERNNRVVVRLVNGNEYQAWIGCFQLSGTLPMVNFVCPLKL